ncbi:sulfatase-like hydrolase/transferase [Halovenus salina]|uniref:Sulfatase-like hydrolase/transferase n=1 Tax=Halovenus salina TaxID=1510225 RepID=A0ABD5W3D4_9EURY
MTDIVYITVDSLRADHVGWHGYERDTTPFLDSLSESAHTFTNAFSHGCYTRQAFPAMMAAEYPSISQSHGGLSEEYTPSQRLSLRQGTPLVDFIRTHIFFLSLATIADLIDSMTRILSRVNSHVFVSGLRIRFPHRASSTVHSKPSSAKPRKPASIRARRLSC